MGSPTRIVIGIGLVAFLGLALVPGMAMKAVYAVLLTPIFASVVTGIELARNGLYRQAVCLVVAVVLVAGSVGWTVR